MARTRNLASALLGALFGIAPLAGCTTTAVTEPSDPLTVTWLERGASMRGLRGLVCMPRSLAVADKEVHTRDGERVDVRWLVFNCTGRPLFVNTISDNPKLFVEWKLIPEWDGPAPEMLPFGPLSGPVQLLRPEAWDFFRRLPPVDLAKPGGVDPCDGLLVETDVYVGQKPFMQRAHLRVSRIFVCYAEGSPEKLWAVASREIRVHYE